MFFQARPRASRGEHADPVHGPLGWAYRRVVDDDVVAGISIEELQLATRNHGMPLEALRYAVTPIGLHYLLTHYDIPLIDPVTWRLRVGGLVDVALELSLDDLRAMPSTTRAATMECAGNGRALLDRAASQPWLLEAVGTGSGPASSWRACWRSQARG
jgi:DMSO/TMAO reductase YedYZ molybdopterin-dependent catalytic subunit